MPDVDGPNGKTLWARADRALPGGGIYFSRSARFAGAGVQPGFIASADGCRVTDVDGRSYIDFLCGNGPILLGYQHPEVEDAFRRQAEIADSATYFPPALVEFAERLVDRTSGMSWAAGAKNGSDVVGLAMRVARAAKGRETIIAFDRAYHGFVPELALGPAGIPKAGQTHVIRVPWNNVEAFEQAVVEQTDDLAAILLNPVDQYPACDTETASSELIAAIHSARSRTGAAIILDDVRTGLRLHPFGSHLALGLEPDLLCLGKPIANGHAVSALIGTEALREGARKVGFTATFCFAAASLKASIATLDIYDREDGFEKICHAGERLRSGLQMAATKYSHRVRQTGPVSMPTLLFEDDPKLETGRRFSREAALRGALFHPNLNWFLNTAHDDAAIDEAIEIATEAFRMTPTTDPT
jgi:glutamate-1-semialdehyde 2,1-aminomutase